MSGGFVIPRIPRSLRVAVFALYVPILFLGTHWPNLRIEAGEIPRPDLLVHLTAFGLWAFLLTLADIVGHPRLPRTALSVLVIGVLYAAFDETLQGIPLLNRTVAFDDFAANCAGIALGTAAASAFARIAPAEMLARPNDLRRE